MPSSSLFVVVCCFCLLFFPRFYFIYTQNIFLYFILINFKPKVSGFVNYFDRLHPEDYAARHLTSLRGIWGTTARNQVSYYYYDTITTITNI